MAVARTSVGTFVSGTAAITAAFGAGATAGDLGILIVETANQGITTPTGWTNIQGAGEGTAGAAGATFISTYWKFITSGDITGGAAISDSGDHQCAVLLTFSGCDPTTPEIITFLGVSSGATTGVSVTIPNVAGTVTANDLAIACIATDRDSSTVSTNSAAAWANITGSNSFIVNGSTASGAGGGIIVNQLTPSAGQTGNVTFSCTITSSAYEAQILVLKAPASGTTYNDTISEALTAGDPSLSNNAVFASPITEGLTSTFTPASAVVFPNTLTENATLADSLLAGLIITKTLTEALTGADSNAASATFNNTITDSIIAGDSNSVSAAFNSLLTENITATQANAALATFVSSLTEPLSATDSLTAAAIYVNTLNELATLGDNYSTGGGQTYSATITEGLTATDSITVGLIIVAAITETVAANYSAAVSAVLSNTITEAVAAGDSVSSVLVMLASIVETLTATDSTQSALIVNAALAEALTATDQLDAGLSFDEVFAESLTAGDEYTASSAFVEALTEALTLSFALDVSGGSNPVPRLTANPHVREIFQRFTEHNQRNGGSRDFRPIGGNQRRPS